MIRRGRISRKRVIWILSGIIFVLFFIWTTPHLSQEGTIKVWDRNNILLYESSGSVGSKTPVSYDKFPKDLIDATIASEDETFWTNPGIDLQAIGRSFVLNLQQRRIVSGASTITQQLARSTIVTSHESYPESFLRKMREIVMALRINATHSKKDILTMYLNSVYFGNLAYGAQAASRTYFNKDVSELSLSESAFLAGLISSPGNRDPFTNILLAKKRQEYVLDLMSKNKFINEENRNSALQEKISLVHTKGEIKASHFVQYVLDEVENLHLTTKQGINIYTTLDYPTYTLSATIAKIWVNKLKDEHDLSNAALVLLKNDTGEVIDMLGGIDYFDSDTAGEENMTVALRQPGSALKPVTYATAFMEGYTPATLIYDVPKVYITKKGEGYTPNNYDGRYHGMVLAREALASSLNLPAVEMLSRVGIPNFLSTARRLGITTLTQEERYDLSLTLGGGEVTLLDLTNVYAGFARGGVYKKPYVIQKITSDTGKILYEKRQEQGVQGLGPHGEQVAYLISNILSDPQARLLGFYEKNPLVLTRPAAVKTGTTTDWHDNWTVGYTPSYTVGVWVGNNDNHAMKEITGVVGAAPIWNQFFEEYLKGKRVEQFARPPGITTRQICKLTGFLPDSLCPERMTEVFISGTEPKKLTTVYKKVKLDTRNNLLAGPRCPPEYVEDRVMVDYPSELYSWAVANKQETIPTGYSPFCNGDRSSSPVSLIQITYPRPGTIFQNAPDLVSNQGIVFEVSVSADISSVQWNLDGKPLSSVSTFPYSFTWYPRLGKHTLQAVGLAPLKRVTSNTTSFTVVPYGSN